MTSRYFATAFLIFSLGVQLALDLSLVRNAAEAQNKKKQTAKATPKKATAEKPKTIGDILKNIEKKAEKVQFSKQKSALPQTTQQQAAQVNFRQVKPPASKKLYYEEGTDEAELEKVLDEQINQLYNLTQQYKRSSKRGELWLRLAELYVEKARLIEFRLQARHDQQMEAFQAGKIKTKPKLNLEPSLAYNRKAIQLYEWFIRDFPKDPKMDQALFFLGFNHFELNEVKKGQEYYLRLTKEYPNSQYVVESNFALGEYNFENEKWKEALSFYSKVAQEKKSRLYSFALYKSAWCYYKMQNTKRGLTFLEQVILEGRRSKGAKEGGHGGVSRVRLATEAIKDLIVFYAEAGDPSKARDYFEDVVGKRSASANLAKLANYYMDTGNRTAARTMFRDLIAEDPTAPRAFDYQHNIVKMLQYASASTAFKDELYTWIEGYGPNSPWAAANEKDKELVKKANEVMESTLRNYVLQQHQTAQNSRARSSQQSARNGYELYFKTFGRSARADEMHFFYGELLFDLEDYDRAAQNYNWVTENAPKSAYYDKALLNALLALEKRLPTYDKIKKVVGDSTQPVEFDTTIKNFEQAAIKYLDAKPKGENVVNVKYRLGTLYYYFNQFDPAIRIFNDIIKNHSKSEFAKHSANHLLDIYNLKKDYVGLQAAADEILSVSDLAKSDVGNQIRDIKLRTDFKLATDLEAKKDYSGAAKAYESFALKNKTNALAVPATFNAAVNYERAGDTIKALTMYSMVYENRGKGHEDLKSKSFKFLPPLYEKTGQYQKAAQYFEGYANQNPKDPVAGEYLFNAAVIYDGLNQFANAVRNYEKYFQQSKKADRFETLFLLARIAERQGRPDAAIAQYEKYINSGTSNALGVVEAHYRIAKIHESRKRVKPAEEWFQKTVAVQLRLSRRGQPVGAAFAAEAKFKLVFKTYNELLSTRIPQDPKAQAAAVQKKLALVNRLKEQLKEVIAYDDGYQIVAALTLQAQSLHHMYDAILAAPLPKGLNAEELKQYKEGVQKIADPFKTQALETYAAAISRGYELQAYNDWLIKAMRNSAALKGENTPIMNTQVILTKLPDWMGM